MADGTVGPKSGAEVMKGLKVKRTPAVFKSLNKFKSRRHAALFHAMGEVRLPGDFAEFGVYEGESARFITAFTLGDRKLHLFDSFLGLPEDWHDRWTKGYFDVGGKIPARDLDRTRVHVGWFKDTVPAFRMTHEQPLAFINMDCDLYNSTMDVLEPLNDLIVKDTVIIFDEYIYGDTEDEHRALLDWSTRYGRTFEYLFRSKWVQVAIRMTN